MALSGDQPSPSGRLSNRSGQVPQRRGPSRCRGRCDQRGLAVRLDGGDLLASRRPGSGTCRCGLGVTGPLRRAARGCLRSRRVHRRCRRLPRPVGYRPRSGGCHRQVGLGAGGEETERFQQGLPDRPARFSSICRRGQGAGGRCGGRPEGVGAGHRDRSPTADALRGGPFATEPGTSVQGPGSSRGGPGSVRGDRGRPVLRGGAAALRDI